MWRNISSKIFAEDVERSNDAWIFINFLTKNVKVVERQLEKDDERGVWKCEYRDSGLVPEDVIEYWVYVERDGVGYYSSKVIGIEGEFGNLIKLCGCVEKCILLIILQSLIN